MISVTLAKKTVFFFFLEVLQVDFSWRKRQFLGTYRKHAIKQWRLWLTADVWMVFSYLAMREEPHINFLSPCPIFPFTDMWHPSPNLLKTILSHLKSAFVLPAQQWLDDMYHFNRTNTQQNPKRYDLQSWIRVLSYLPKLFVSFLILSSSLSLRKLASFTAATAELIVNYYPRDKAAVTLS